MSDRRIARAAHPIINAWRCQVGNVLHQGKLYAMFNAWYLTSSLVDNDDDGETAAGGRLAHLLQILVSSLCIQTFHPSYLYHYRKSIMFW